MKASFAWLLVGGGVVLMVGLFTGRIQFPLGGGTFSSALGVSSKNAPNTKVANLGCGGAIPMNDPRCTGSTVSSGFSPAVNGGCPTGTMVIHVSGGKDVCM